VKRAIEFVQELKGAGLIVGPFLLVVDLALNALDVLALGLPTWLLAGAGVVLFLSSCVAILRDHQKKIDLLTEELSNLRSRTPMVSVQVVNEHDYRGTLMCLEIRNDGDVGEFQAEIEVLEGREFIHGLVRPPLPRYRGYWELGAGPVSKLAQGGHDRLRIGHHILGAPSYSSAEFTLAFYAHVEAQYAEFGTVSWDVVTTQFVRAKFRLKITITCDPKMAAGPYVEEFSVDGSFEDGRYLRELPLE
jgi:hypothetical protein